MSETAWWVVIAVGNLVAWTFLLTVFPRMLRAYLRSGQPDSRHG